MIKQIITIAKGEWQYWLRSHIVLGAALIFLVLFIATSVVTALHINAEQHARAHQQEQAEETFLAQPDRHPHRMVHYGHYVFRAPAPMAVFDPGLDPVTGQSIFLEGHRQNTVMFAESAASADFGGLAWLTPALVYQIFAPFVIILLGHSSIVRERESAVLAPQLAMGISGLILILGKALALISFSLLLLIPLIISCSFALTTSNCIFALLSISAIYFIYLAIWALLVLIVSTLVQKRATVLAIMTGLWFGFCLVLPSVAVNLTSDKTPLAGKIETDLKMLADLRKLGDSHNINDPAFKKLRADILKKYKVKRIEDLPINFRGIVAMEGEKKLTKVLNDYAHARMDAETRQEQQLASFGWLTPTLAITLASRSITGTDLAHYHRFQQEAEDIRFSFVQGLNRAHAKALSYQADINRNKDDASFKRARVDAANWQVLDAYEFSPSALSKRNATAAPSAGMLLAWLVLALIVLIWCGRRIKP